jgi:hypothetical protein
MRSNILNITFRNYTLFKFEGFMIIIKSNEAGPALDTIDACDGKKRQNQKGA